MCCTVVPCVGWPWSAVPAHWHAAQQQLSPTSAGTARATCRANVQSQPEPTSRAKDSTTPVNHRLTPPRLQTQAADRGAPLKYVCMNMPILPLPTTRDAPGQMAYVGLVMQGPRSTGQRWPLQGSWPVGTWQQKSKGNPGRPRHQGSLASWLRPTALRHTVPR